MKAVLGAAIGLWLVAAPSNTVLPVYRDLLKPAPFDVANYGDRCGPSGGAVQILRPGTPRAEAIEIARGLDADDVQGLAERSLARAATALPGATVTICLFPGELSGGLPYLDGVGGVSFGDGRINLVLHPGPGGLRRVTYTVAHEYHHEVERRIAPGGYGPIDIMIREGKADYFATQLYPELRPPHTTRLSDAEFTRAWPELLAYEGGSVTPAAFRSSFMIGRDFRALRWPGYRLGYEMVESYFRSKKIAPALRMSTPARDIYDEFRRRGRQRNN
jgi:uncharacterized protein YjaZ